MNVFVPTTLNPNKSQRLTDEALTFFTHSTRPKVDDYSIGCRIAKYKAQPGQELRTYFALCNKIKKTHTFAQAALDTVDWDFIASALAS